jgi:hypothetical protein
MVFGCDEDTTENITARIENSEDAWVHPMLIFGILAELERERHAEVVRQRVFHLLGLVYGLSRYQSTPTDSEFRQEAYSLDLWMSVSQLRDGLKALKAHLHNMIEHIDELEWKTLQGNDYDLKLPASPTTTTSPMSPKLKELEDKPVSRQSSWGSTTETLASEEDDGDMSPSFAWRVPAVLAGRRIKKRLREILSDYDQKIHECTMVLDGMSLSTQLVRLFLPLASEKDGTCDVSLADQDALRSPGIT